MKKALPILLTTILFMFVLPVAAFKLAYTVAGLVTLIIIFLVVPIFSIVLGFYSGKDINRRWYLPVISAALFLAATLVSFGFKWDLMLTEIAVVLLVLGIGVMLVSSRAGNKHGSTKRAVISTVVFSTLAIIVLVPFIPSESRLSDGGTVWYSALTYRVIRYHQACDLGTDVDGVRYYYSTDRIGYIVGTEISVLGHVIYDDTHVEPPVPDPLPYEDYVRDLISYYEQSGIENAKPLSIGISNKGDPYAVIIIFNNRYTTYQCAYSIYQLTDDYLSNTDSALIDGASLLILNFIDYSINIDPDTHEVTSISSRNDWIPIALTELLPDAQVVYE